MVLQPFAPSISTANPEESGDHWTEDICTAPFTGRRPANLRSCVDRLIDLSPLFPAPSQSAEYRPSGDLNLELGFAPLGTSISRMECACLVSTRTIVLRSR